MNQATLMKFGSTPALAIWPTPSGDRTDITGITNHETGQSYLKLYYGEKMPSDGTDAIMWITHKTQDEIGCRIKSKQLQGSQTIQIEHVYAADNAQGCSLLDTSTQPAPTAA